MNQAKVGYERKNRCNAFTYTHTYPNFVGCIFSSGNQSIYLIKMKSNSLYN